MSLRQTCCSDLRRNLVHKKKGPDAGPLSYKSMPAQSAVFSLPRIVSLIRVAVSGLMIFSTR